MRFIFKTLKAYVLAQLITSFAIGCAIAYTHLFYEIPLVVVISFWVTLGYPITWTLIIFLNYLEHFDDSQQKFFLFRKTNQSNKRNRKQDN